MSLPTNIQRELQILLTRSLENAADSRDHSRLEWILREYPEALDLYHRTISLDLALRHRHVFSADHSADDSFAALLVELAREEQTAPAVARPRPRPVRPAESPARQERRPQATHSSRLLPLVAAVCAVLLVTLVLTAELVHWWQRPRPVATVIDALDARVEGPAPVTRQTRLTTRSDALHLIEGILKIRFDTGVRVVVEAPAVFHIDTARQVTLTQGKLYAQVSPTGRGFRVRTALLDVVDLGTEFGVAAQERSTAIHMIRGRARLTPKGPRRAEPADLLLRTGQARTASTEQGLREIDLDPAAFVRDINSITGTTWRGQWLTVVDLPSRGTDAACQIMPAKHYTHCLDFGTDQGVVINGVRFHPVDVNESDRLEIVEDAALGYRLQRFGARALGSFRHSDPNVYVDGAMAELLRHAIFLSRQDPGHYYRLTLTGLTPGQRYSLRLYYCPDSLEPSRVNRLVFNGQGEDVEILVDETRPGGAHVVRYDYTAASDRVTVACLPRQTDRSWHLYGLTNEEVNLGP